MAERFAAAGKRVYLVGGIVRDLLAGRPLDQPDIDLTTDARPSETKRIVSRMGRRGLDAGRAIRNDRRQARRRGRSRSRRIAPTPTDPTRASPMWSIADAIEADLSRRDFTVNSMALTLPEPSWSTRSTGATICSSHRRLRTPLVAGRVVQRRSAAHAARGALHRGLRLDARTRLGRGRRPPARIGSRSCRPSASATSSTSCSWSTIRRPGLWFLYETGLFDEFMPEIPALRLEQDPSTITRTCSRTRSRWSANVAPRRGRRVQPDRPARRAAARHRQAEDALASVRHGVSFHHHEVVGARMARERLAGAALSRGRRATRSPGSSTCICGSTATRRATVAGPTARCAATSAMQVICSTSSTS